MVIGVLLPQGAAWRGWIFTLDFTPAAPTSEAAGRQCQRTNPDPPAFCCCPPIFSLLGEDTRHPSQVQQIYRRGASQSEVGLLDLDKHGPWGPILQLSIGNNQFRMLACKTQPHLRLFEDLSPAHYDQHGLSPVTRYLKSLRRSRPKLRPAARRPARRAMALGPFAMASRSPMIRAVR